MSERSPGVRLFGAILMGVGALIFGLCGLCTAGFQLTFAYEWLVYSSSNAEIWSVLLPLAIGIVPIIIGLGLFFLGRTMRRPSAPP